MGGEGRDSRNKTYRVEVVRGEPYHVGDRELIPEARISSYGRARATIGTHRTGGWGVGLVQVKPLAIVERTAQGERRIVIPDTTTRSMGLMLGAAAAIMVIFTTLRWLVRRRRGASIEG